MTCQEDLVFSRTFLDALPTKKPGFYPDLWVTTQDFREKTWFLASRARSNIQSDRLAIEQI